MNINIGPGESEWFGVEGKYFTALRSAVWTKSNIDILRNEGNWFPKPEDLNDIKIPYFHGIQRAGDGTC